MRPSALPAITVVAVLVLAGCAGPAGTNTDEDGPSPDEFPNASAIDQSVFDRHAALLTNTSFTVRFEKTEKRPNIQPPPNVTYFNHTERVLVEPGASQYLSQPNGTLDYLGTTNIQSVYTNGNNTYQLVREDNESTVQTANSRSDIHPIFNESNEEYLWQGWMYTYKRTMYWFPAQNITYERKGIETFQGVAVMRYEATGVDALPEQYRPAFADFSTTLLLDADGVVRYYRVDANQTDGSGFKDYTRVHTVSDVGSTDVQKPDWVSNTTTGS